MLQRELAEPHLDADVCGMRGKRPVGGEQGQPCLPLAVPLEGLDAVQPRRLLAVVDLPEIQDVPIDHAPARTAALLRNAPIAVFLAVLDPAMALQVHGGCRLLHSPYP